MRNRRIVMPLLGLVLVVAGCHRDAGLVRVSGRMTLRGGPWPAPGVVIFSPVDAAAGSPHLVGMARLETDGSFSASTGEVPGLMPGRYKIAIQSQSVYGHPYGRHPDSHEQKEAKASPHKEEETGGALVRYASAATSTLELTVPSGSPPVTFNADVR